MNVFNLSVRFILKALSVASGIVDPAKSLNSSQNVVTLHYHAFNDGFAAKACTALSVIIKFLRKIVNYKINGFSASMESNNMNYLMHFVFSVCLCHLTVYCNS